jgi:RNA polymerase sigma factor (TIGR02999 family)
MSDSSGASAASPSTRDELATLLRSSALGERASFDRAFALLYDELMVLARAQRRRWEGNATLNTTVLVHEAYVKLSGGAVEWDGRRHFFALAAQVMRQVLVNYAEGQRAAKRGGDADLVTLGGLEESARPDPTFAPLDDNDRVLALNEALARLAALDERKARIVECRFFAGYSIPETATALAISEATVKREWHGAREWLARELGESSGGEL